MDANAALAFTSITGPVALPRNARPPVSPSKETEPAVSIMTDFTTSTMFSVNAEVQIDQALDCMKAVGVKLLFVLKDESQLTGFITTTDILGDRPMRYLHSIDASHTAAARNNIVVKHVMSRIDEWMVLDYPTVHKAQISQVVASFQSTGRRHLVVTETGQFGTAVRGVISATRIEQALGKPLHIVPKARTFAEIEHAVIRT